MPIVIVHSLAQAVAALTAAAEANRDILLASAPDAGIYAGAGWFAAMLHQARQAVPDARCVEVLDCGDDAGAAMAAVRAGVEAVVFVGRADVAARLADIASQAGVRLLTSRPVPALDLGTMFFADGETLCARVAMILASPPAFC